MKLSVSTYSLARWRTRENKSVEQCIDWLAEQGVDGVEFSGLGENVDGDPIRRARALRKRCEKHGLAVAGYCVGAELLKPDAEQRAEVDRVRQHIDVAAELGAPTMRHDVTRGPNDATGKLTLSQVLKRVVPAVRELTEYGQSVGVVTSLENHGFYLQTPDRVQKLIEAVDHPNFGLTLDLGNWLCLNEDPVAAVRQVGKYAVMVHAKDFYIRSKRQVPPPAPAQGKQPELPAGWIVTPTPIAIRGAVAGHGQVDLPAQLRLVKRAGYKGYLSLEFEGPEYPPDAVRLGLAYLRKQLA